MKVNVEFGSDFAAGEVEGFKLEEKIVGDSRRWVTGITSVLKHEESGKFYGYDWDRGNTESQENEYPEGEIDLPEMVKKTVTKEVWSYVE